MLPKPGVWVSGRDGARLAGMLAEGPVNVRLSVETDTRPAESSNVLGELPGADEEIVAVGSHHDAGWGSAVEDASGVALVLAQAEYWSRVPREERPHRMLFVLHGGHMAGGAGHQAFRAAHDDELARMVLAVHLEHAALECVENDGKLVSTGRPEPRWWFTSRSPLLEASVAAALEAERLARSVIVPPTVFGGDAPPTDAHGFFLAGVPTVSMLAAPFYLFDSQDTPDKVDRENLAALTRATVRIVESTRGETAKSMRAAVEEP
jgi:Zn-dependent M28 family amino/carboxypeptidase